MFTLFKNSISIVISVDNIINMMSHRFSCYQVLRATLHLDNIHLDSIHHLVRVSPPAYF